MRTFTIILLMSCAGFSCCANSDKVSLGTFNARLRPSIPRYEEKITKLIDLIRESHLDIICLQDVYKSDTQRQIYGNISDLYPYHVSHIDLMSRVDAESAERVCPPGLAERYGECLRNCHNQDSFQECVIEECAKLVFPVSRECRLCLFANYHNPDTCGTHPVTSYETSFGLMLLSRLPITSSHSQGYLGELSDVKGFLKAVIDKVGHVYCTRLSTGTGKGDEIYSGPPFVFPWLYDSYDAQQLDEITTLMNIVATSGKKDNVVLMGDFNHGPVVPTPPGFPAILSHMPLNYSFLTAQGFYSPYVIRDGRCTLCTENTASSAKNNKVIDHIYVPVTARDRVVHAERMWDDVHLSGVPLSDHYGVKLLLKPLTFCSSDKLFCFFRGGTASFPPFTFPAGHLANICSGRNHTDSRTALSPLHP